MVLKRCICAPTVTYIASRSSWTIADATGGSVSGGSGSAKDGEGNAEVDTCAATGTAAAAKGTTRDGDGEGNAEVDTGAAFGCSDGGTYTCLIGIVTQTQEKPTQLGSFV